MGANTARNSSRFRSTALWSVTVALSLGSGGCAQNGGGAGLNSGFSAFETGSIGSAGTSAVIAKARDLQVTGNATTAAKILGQAYVKSPNDPELRRAYAIAALDAGNARLAYQVTTRKDAKQSNDPRLLSVRGAALSVLGHHDKAEQAFASALSLAPDDPDLMNNLGMALALKGDVKNAESLLRRAAVARQDTKDGRARENLALVVGLQGRFDEAAALSKSARVAAGSVPSGTAHSVAPKASVATAARNGLGGPGVTGN